MSSSREDLMRQAIAAARENASGERGGPFGAVVAKNGRILARCPNRVLEKRDPTAHAEIEAIREAAAALGTHDLSGCEIYASCEPCPMCLGAIQWARIERVFYGATKEEAARLGFDDLAFYREMALPQSERSVPAFRILGDEAASVFEEWARSETRRIY